MVDSSPCNTPEKQALLRGKSSAVETSPFSLFAKELPPITPPEPAHPAGSTAYSPQRSPLSSRQDLSNASWQRQIRGQYAGGQRCTEEQHISKNSDAPLADAAPVMLFGSPLPHMPRSPHDPSAGHLSLSPHRNNGHSGMFSPGSFHTLFQSPAGATLDDSPFQSLSHPPAKHSPVSAAAHYSAAQASRQASAGQAQAQRMEQQHCAAGMSDAAENASASMLVPVNAPAVLSTNKQAPYPTGDTNFVDRMPSFTSLVSGPPAKRQRCLQFGCVPEQGHSSQEYSSQSPSPSCSQQESHSNADHQSQSQQRGSSTAQSDQADATCSNDGDSSKAVSVKQEDPSQQPAASVRAPSRQALPSSGAFPALAAALGAQAPNAAKSAASQAAAAAAAVTPVTSRHMSSQSGEEASQSVLHPDTPGDAIVTVKDRRLSTSSTRYRRVQHSTTSGPKRCNCKKSKCLKLYCDCFAAGVYCQNCSCSCCMNTEENKDLIVATREQIIQRNPQAFDLKISKQRAVGADGTAGQHLRGCNCKKSHCRKKYCECFQAGVPCGPQCKCCDCHNCSPGGKGAPPRPPSAHPSGASNTAQQAAHGQGPTKTSPGTPAVRAASLGPEDGALHRPVPEQAPALPQIKKQDSRPSVPLPTRRRDPRSRRGHHQDVVAADLQASQTRPSRDFSEPAWAGLSRSMSEGAAAAQPWITKSPNTQVLAQAPVVNSALPISPLDPRNSRVKQEECRDLDLQASHSAAYFDFQVDEQRYTYMRRDSGSAALSGSYSQLLTAPHHNSSMVLVPCKNQADQQEPLEGSMHGGSGAYDAVEPHRTSGSSAAPEPYQILMPVQMADGQMTALPPDQAQFAPGTLLVPRSNASAHLDIGMQCDPHSLYVEHQMQPQAQGHQYMSNDSILLQHYAEMAPMGEAGSSLQAEAHLHPSSSNFDMGRVSAGNQLTMSNDDTDLEHLIKGGPFELGLYADKLGSHMFGIDSVAQSGTGFSPPPLPWQSAAHQPHQQQQLMVSPMIQPLYHPHHQQQLDNEEPVHSSFQIHRARRPPIGASPGSHGSPAHDFGVRKPTLTKRPGTTPVHLRRRSMSADLEHAEAYDPSTAYPASPSEQQAWTHLNKLPPQGSGGFLRLNSGHKTVFSPHQ